MTNDEWYEETEWTMWTWSEFRANVNALAKSLLFVGGNAHDRVHILGSNAPEWLFAYFGAMAAAMVLAALYLLSPPEDCQKLCVHSRTRVIVCEGRAQVEKYRSTCEHMPDLLAIVNCHVRTG
jgi:long-subunit acyl-CoA synthetase (AMP-forming)